MCGYGVDSERLPQKEPLLRIYLQSPVTDKVLAPLLQLVVDDVVTLNRKARLLYPGWYLRSNGCCLSKAAQIQKGGRSSKKQPPR